jgi:hypothetical protein
LWKAVSGSIPGHAAMARPIYESESDRKRERKVAEIVEQHFKCQLRKAPALFAIDFVAVRNGKPVAWVEIKCRNYSMARIGQMGGYLISIKKLIAAKQLFEITGLKLALIVAATDGVYCHLISDFTVKNLTIGGRTDRGDTEDVEPCALLDVSKFRRLG